MMFRKKKEKEIPFCAKCGCVLKFVSKTVEVKGAAMVIMDVYGRRKKEELTFCKKCVPLYDYIKWVYVLIPLKEKNAKDYMREKWYFKNQPSIRVTEEGKPIKK